MFSLVSVCLFTPGGGGREGATPTTTQDGSTPIPGQDEGVYPILLMGGYPHVADKGVGYPI